MPNNSPNFPAARYDRNSLRARAARVVLSQCGHRFLLLVEARSASTDKTVNSASFCAYVKKLLPLCKRFIFPLVQEALLARFYIHHFVDQIRTPVYFRTPEWYEEALSNDPAIFYKLSEEEQNSPGVCLLAIENGVPSEKVPPKMHQNQEVFRQLCLNDSNYFLAVKAPSFELTLDVCLDSTSMLLSVPQTRELCIGVCEEVGEALEYVNPDILSPEIADAAVIKGGLEVWCVPESFQTFKAQVFSILRLAEAHDECDKVLKMRGQDIEKWVAALSTRKEHIKLYYFDMPIEGWLAFIEEYPYTMYLYLEYEVKISTNDDELKRGDREFGLRHLEQCLRALQKKYISSAEYGARVKWNLIITDEALRFLRPHQKIFAETSLWTLIQMTLRGIKLTASQIVYALDANLVHRRKRPHLGTDAINFLMGLTFHSDEYEEITGLKPPVSDYHPLDFDLRFLRKTVAATLNKYLRFCDLRNEFITRYRSVDITDGYPFLGN